MRSAGALAAVILLAVPAVQAATIRVPGDHPTIRAGLEAAAASDTVLVACGTYHESNLQLFPGITLLGDAADSSCTVIDGGAGLLPILVVRGADCTVGRLTFRNGLYAFGAAIHVAVTGMDGPRVTRCRFVDNRAMRRGGAIHADAIRADACAFVGNRAVDEGGAIYASWASLDGCVFEDNTAGDSGGAVYAESATVTACDFRGNRSGGTGGGATIRGGTVTSGTFRENFAAGSAGGAFTLGVDVSECTFRADSAATGGGMIAVGGRVERCLFVRNRGAASAGGLRAEGSAVVTNCRFVENTSGGPGGGMVSVATVEACTFLRNAATSGGGASVSGYRFAHCVIQGTLSGGAFEGSAADVPENCNFFGNAGGDWSGTAAAFLGVNGNFSADALFCGGPAESLTISSASPLLPQNNAWGVHIGAEEVGCEPDGVVVTTVPAGLPLVVDGQPIATPAVFPWTPGSSHALEAPESQDLAPGVRFVWEQWTDGGPRAHVVTAPGGPATFAARFSPRYFVTVEADAHGTAAPPSGWYPREYLMFTAQPDSAWRHTGWTGTGIGSYTGAGLRPEFRIIAPVTERAHFVFWGTYPLTMVVDGGGSVTPPGGDYFVGTQVPIHASTPPGHFFDGWTGEGAGSYTGPDSVAAVVMAGPVTQTAHFRHVGFAPVVLQAYGPGSVIPASGDYPQLWPLQIDAIPDPGAFFHRWWGEGPGSYTGPIRTALVHPAGPVTQTAYFTADGTFPLTVTASPGGAASPASGNIPAGNSVPLVATAATGYLFREWQGTGPGSYSGPDPHGVATIHGPVTEHAVFERDTAIRAGYELSVSASDTDPFVTLAPPANGPRSLYLWLTCSELGLAALEAGVGSNLLVSEFVPAPGVVDVGPGADLVLAVAGCPGGANASRILGSWSVLDTGGQVWLTKSSARGVFAAVDCADLPTVWSDPLVRGFSSSGPAPVTGENGCEGTVSVVLTQLAAVPGNRSVLVTWVTSAEVDHAGFHVYRSEAVDGPYVRVTADLLTGGSPHRFEDRSAGADRIYHYKVGAVDVNGREDLFGPVRVVTPDWSPRVTALWGAFPNPFRGETEFRFSLATQGPVRLALYDLAGRLVHVLHEGESPVGEHVVPWDGRTSAGTAASGIYFLRFHAGDRRETKRVVFLGPPR